MIAYGHSSDYTYWFTDVVASTGYPYVQLFERRLVRQPGKKTYKTVLRMWRSNLVERLGAIEVEFDEPVPLVNFAYKRSGKICPPGRYVFECLAVTIPSLEPPAPSVKYEYPKPHNPTLSQILKLLDVGKCQKSTSKTVELAVLPRTTIGMAWCGLENQQQRQYRRQQILQTEARLLRVLRIKLCWSKRLNLKIM